MAADDPPIVAEVGPHGVDVGDEPTDRKGTDGGRPPGAALVEPVNRDEVVHHARHRTELIPAAGAAMTEHHRPAVARGGGPQLDTVVDGDQLLAVSGRHVPALL